MAQNSLNPDTVCALVGVVNGPMMKSQAWKIVYSENIMNLLMCDVLHLNLSIVRLLFDAYMILCMHLLFAFPAVCQMF